jgi:multidrug resistance efflux pump
MMSMQESGIAHGLPRTIHRPHSGAESGLQTVRVGRPKVRILRIVIGLGLFGLPAWFLLPGVWTVRSSQAIVNAQVITLTSPIKGVVTLPPPPLRQLVSEGSVLLRIDSPMVDRKQLEEMQAEVAGLTERVAAMKQQLGKVESLKRELATSFQNYKDSMVRRISHELEEARSEAEAAVAALSQRKSEESEEQAIWRRGFGSRRELSKSRFAAKISSKTVNRANAAVARLADQLESMKNGIFTGPGDSRNDVPYSRQRMHEITLQQLSDEARLRENQARITELDSQIKVEVERVRLRASYEVKAPVNGIMWRQFIASGSPVAPQTELLQIVDVSTVFIDAALNEKFADDVKPGDKVMIRLIGSDLEIPGTIRYVVGEGLQREDRTLAAEPPKDGQHQVHAIIDFDNTSSGARDFNQFYVGRRVDVRFPDVAKSVLRLW